ncbi:MAG: AsmA-like C-terminal region-containing protein [bacterium]|nr:AsmA-like C-terminal region-containing protein [bacterium]MCP4800042.1 AsmA-like C-terminal region-containing protein [bacterium]
MKFIRILVSVLIVVILLIKVFTMTPMFGKQIEKQVFLQTGNQLICDSYGVTFLGSPGVTCKTGSLILSEGGAVSFSNATAKTSWGSLFKGTIREVDIFDIAITGERDFFVDTVNIQGEMSAKGNTIVDVIAEFYDMTLTGTVVTDQVALDVDDAKLHIGDGVLTGNVSCKDITVSEPLFRFNMVGKEIPVDGVALDEYLSGKIDCSVEGDFAVGNGEVLPMSITADGDITVSDGVVSATEVLSGIKQYLGNRTDLLEIDFDGFSHHMTLNNGKYSVGELRLEGPDTDWTGSGIVSLVGDVDFMLETRLPTGFTPDLGDMTFMADLLRDNESRISIPLRVKGKLPKPAVKLDLSQQQGTIEDNIESGIKGFLDKLKRR